jgi:UDP-glucose 4-epimerase
VNVHGTLCLLQAMETVDCEKIVFSSSAAVYGEPRYIPIDEKHPCAPTNPYGRTKWMVEQMLVDWQSARPSASVVLLRYFNPVGAHNSMYIGEDPLGVPNNLIPVIAQVAAGRRNELCIFGDDYATPDGTAIRDYIHVTDLARAHASALLHAAEQPTTDAFNLGSGCGYSVLEVVKAFIHTSGRPVRYRIAPRREGDVSRSLADPSHAEAVLGWRAEQGLTEMSDSAWRWECKKKHG